MAKGATKKPAKKSAKKATKEPQELRITQLEQVELNLCERDWELSLKEIELAEARIRNLTLDFHQKQAALKEMKRSAQAKSEQLALIRNKKLAEVEHRLQKIDASFSFKDYLEQDDGLLVPNEDKIVAMDPTAGDEGDGGDSVTA